MNIVMAGDWNVVRDIDLDKVGGNDYVKNIRLKVIRS